MPRFRARGAVVRPARRAPSPYPSWFYLPAAIIYGVLFLFPTVASLFFSLTRWTLQSATFIGFAAGGFVMGRVADRFGISVPVSIAGVALGIGFVLAALSQSYWQFILVQAVLIGFLGSAATFGPLVADDLRV